MIAHKKVLVLNRSWKPVAVLTLEKALIKLFSEYKDGEPKDIIVDCSNDFQTLNWNDWSKTKPKDGEEIIRSVNATFRIPSVIQLTRYDKIPNRKVYYCRKTLYKRDQYQCQYCGKRPGTEELSIDHVIPRSRGGLTTWENCALACIKCNTKKANRTPLQANMTLLRIPKKPKFNALKCDYIVKDWESFLGAAYWLVELENDES